MRYNIIKGYFVKEMLELVRTKMILMPFFIPFLIVVLFGYGIKMQVTDVRVHIIDNDKTNLSTTLISKFEHSKYFKTSVGNISEKEAFQKIKQASKDVIIIIPSSFEKNILKNIKSEVGVFIDASFPSRATTIMNYIQGVVLSLASEFQLQGAGAIILNNRNLFNQALRDEEMIVPGLLGLVLLVSPAILTALLVAKEKEKGTIFNFYSSSVTKSEFVIAKLSAVFSLASLNLLLLFLLVIYLFDLPFRGSFLLYWLSSEIYIFIALSIGFLISILVSSQIVAVIVTLLMTILPGFLYSGMLMPISSMGSEAYIIAHIYPVMYYNHIIYDVFLIGQGFASIKIVLYLGLLTLYAIGLFLLAIFLLKKEIR